MQRKPTKLIMGTSIPDKFDFIELSDNDLNMSMPQFSETNKRTRSCKKKKTNKLLNKNEQQ